MQHSPVENIEVDDNIITRMSNTLEIDSTYDINDSFAKAIALSQHELSEVLSYMNIYLRMGMIDENEYDVPIITCEDSTQQIPVIYFKKSNQTKISLQDDCVIAEARTEIDFIRIKDRLLYGLLGII